MDRLIESLRKETVTVMDQKAIRVIGRDRFAQLLPCPINKTGCINLLALNRSLDQELAMEVTANGFEGLALLEALTLHSGDLAACNDRAAPGRVKPGVLDGVEVHNGRIVARLPAASWNIVRLTVSS